MAGQDRQDPGRRGLSPVDPRALVACHECDALQKKVALGRRGSATCVRCGAVLYRHVPGGLDRTVAYLVAAAILFLVSNMLPLVSLEAQGSQTSTTLIGTVLALHDTRMDAVGALVAFTAIVMPGLQIAALLYLLLPLRFGRVPLLHAQVYRTLLAMRPWGMVEVFMLGTLVALVKLGHIATVIPGLALFSVGALMFLMTAASATFEPHEFWDRVDELKDRAPS